MNPNLSLMLSKRNSLGVLIMALISLGILQSCSGIAKEEIDPNDIISISVRDINDMEISEAIGDGMVRIFLNAQILQDPDEDLKTVTFKASEGDFEGVSENAADVIVDNLGMAQAQLRLPLNDDILFLSAEVKGKSDIIYRAETSIQLTAPDQVIHLEFRTLDGQTLNELPRADGTSFFQLEGEVLTDTQNLNTVKFTASQGLFQDNGTNTITKNTTNDNKALVVYQVPQNAGSAFYSASTGSAMQYVAESNQSFERAHADAIFMEPASLNMTTASANLISVFLTRTIGKVSVETLANYEAFQLIDNEEVPVGRFTGLSSAFSDPSGKVIATFYADTGDIDFLLPVRIKASTITDSGATIVVMQNITVTE